MIESGRQTFMPIRTLDLHRVEHLTLRSNFAVTYKDPYYQVWLYLDKFFFQFYNMIKQQAIEKMGLKQIKRDFFDPGNVIEKPEWQVAIWPGYKTTIRQHERELLLG